MPITIQNDSIAGLAAGGLPNAVITQANLASGVGGRMLQVAAMQTATGWEWSSSSANSFIDIDGNRLNINYTPSSASTKLIFTVWGIANLVKGLDGVEFRLFNTTDNVQVGTSKTAIRKDMQSNPSQNIFHYDWFTFHWIIDSWGTTQKNFKVQIRQGEGTGFVFLGHPPYGIIVREYLP
jgi:hypothetical protein